MNLSYIYETDRIGVKGLSTLELDGAYPNWFSDSEVCLYNSHIAFPMNKVQCEEYISSTQANRSVIVWAVYHKQDKKHIGNISLQSIDWISRGAEIAFLFGEKQYWGKGYAQEAAELLIKHGFNVLNLNRIHCGTAAPNKGMRCLAKKLGLKEEGRRREALYLNNHYEDIIEFGLLKRDCSFGG